jgi:formamidopyrimidine-DNA glycosylase
VGRNGTAITGGNPRTFLPAVLQCPEAVIGLTGSFTGQTIKSVEVIWSKTLRPSVLNNIIGQTITALKRRAKVLIIELSGGQSLLFHLKMTGQLVLVEPDGNRLAGGHPTSSMAAQLPDSSTRVIFTLSSGDKLFFNDQRKFGWIMVVSTSQVNDHALLSRVGPEPLSEDFTLEGFAGQLRRHPVAPIKAVILDQSTVAGVGNIYADESLHLAKIHPADRTAQLTKAEIKRLYEAIKSIIAAGIEHGGTSFSHYVNALGVKGDYLDQARAFGRTGQPCPVCATPIEKIRVAGRGTHICPRCQKLKRVGRTAPADQKPS